MRYFIVKYESGNKKNKTAGILTISIKKSQDIKKEFYKKYPNYEIIKIKETV